jgi:hypothetical protein
MLEHSLGGKDEVLSSHRVFDAVCEASENHSARGETTALRWQTIY